MPSGNPSSSPSLSAAPSLTILCDGLTLEEWAQQLLEIVLDISDLTELEPESPQAEAYEWLLDEQIVCPDEEEDVLQRYVMAVLYFSTNGDSWTNCTRAEASAVNPTLCPSDGTRFLSTSDVCFWFGVTCGRSSITEISIDENNLDGPLPDEIGKLEELEDIDFDGNRFISGQIPDGWANLDELMSIDLDNNAITGPIPESLFTNSRLENLDLDSNEISGSISTRFGELDNLELLLLDKNLITGTLPTELGELDRMRFLTLDTNFLSGPIPDTWDSMERLRVLTLHKNVNINGTIPTFLGDFEDLQLLSLFSTDISGPIPSELGELTELRNLFLHNTQLEGTMPQEICDLRTSGRLIQLSADCSGEENARVRCPQPSCCTACF